MTEKQYLVRYDSQIGEKKYKSGQVISVLKVIGDKYKESGALDDNKNAVEHALKTSQLVVHDENSNKQKRDKPS